MTLWILASQAPLSTGFSQARILAAKSLKLCPTLCDPMDCSPPGSSVHGIFQARVLEGAAIAFSKEYWGGLLFPSPGDLPDPEIEPASPALAGGFFTAEPPRKLPRQAY